MLRPYKRWRRPERVGKNAAAATDTGRGVSRGHLEVAFLGFG